MTEIMIVLKRLVAGLIRYPVVYLFIPLRMGRDTW